MGTKISDIMTKNPISYHAPSSVDDVVKILLRKNVTGIGITDSSGKYLGIISRRDIFNNSMETQTAMLMRRIKPVHEDDDIASAAQEMYKLGRRHMAVTDKDGYLMGILTPQNFMPEIINRYGNIPVTEFVSRRVVPVWEETPISIIPEISRLTSIYSFPVLNSEGAFVGLVTDRDIFDKAHISMETVVSKTDVSDDEDPWTWDGFRNMMEYVVSKNMIKLPHMEISKVMVRNPQTVFLNDPVSKVSSIMFKGNFNQVPAMETPDKLAGMIYDVDLLGVFR
jgi:CBS domain-containing protein